MAVVSGEREIRVGEDLLRARKAVILAPGTGAAIPPIPGLRESNPWTNREVTTAKAIPDSLLVLGGGVVGVEMATAYASLGAKVTIVEALPRLIAGEEEFASGQVKDALQAAGVEVVVGTKATAVWREDGSGRSHSSSRTAASFTGDELLVAIGRTPHTDGLGLEELGLMKSDPPTQSIEVDEEMRVPGHEWLYVVGDANGRALLTHMGKYQARLAADHILGRDGCDDGPALRRAALPARDLHRAAGCGRRPHAAERRRRRPERTRRGDVHRGERGRQLRRARRARHGTDRRR